MGFLGVSAVKNLSAVQEIQETWVRSLGKEDPLEEGMAAHSSVLAWRIPWAEEPSGLQSTGSQIVRHTQCVRTMKNRPTMDQWWEWNAFWNIFYDQNIYRLLRSMTKKLCLHPWKGVDFSNVQGLYSQSLLLNEFGFYYLK